MKLKPFSHFLKSTIFFVSLYFAIYLVLIHLMPNNNFYTDINRSEFLTDLLNYILPIITSLLTVSLLFVILLLTCMKDKSFYGIDALQVIIFGDDNYRVKPHSKYNFIKRVFYFFKNTRLIDDIVNILTSLLLAIILLKLRLDIPAAFYILFATWSSYFALISSLGIISVSTDSIGFSQMTKNYIKKTINSYISNSRIKEKDHEDYLDFNIEIILGLRNYIINKDYANVWDDFLDDFCLYENFILNIISNKKYDFTIGYQIIRSAKSILIQKNSVFKNNEHLQQKVYELYFTLKNIYSNSEIKDDYLLFLTEFKNEFKNLNLQ